MPIGLTAAVLAGCRHQEKIPEKPPVYDMTYAICDPETDLMLADVALETGKHVVAQALAPRSDNNKSWTQAESQEGSDVEVANPLVITCIGKIVYVAGTDRGFAGYDSPQLLAYRSNKINYYIFTNGGRSKKEIYPSKLSSFLVRDEMHDPGSTGGAIGLVSSDRNVGYGSMP